jgi:hypothetical protein
MYHWNPKLQFKAPMVSHLKLQSHVDTMLEGLALTHQTHRENILEVQQRPTWYSSGKEIMFNIGDKV